MKTALTFIMCCLCFCAINGQQANIDMCDIIRHSRQNRSTDSVTQLLEFHSKELTARQKADLYSIRGRLNMLLNKKEINKSAKSDHPLVNESYGDLTQAIDLMPEEKDQLKYVARRYFVFNNYESNYKDYQSDLDKLIANGLKEDKTGLGAAIVTRYDGEFWAGVEFSLFSGYAPTYKVKDEDGVIVLHNKTTVSASALVFGFTRNFENTLNDFNLSLLRIEAPVFIDLTKVGYIESPGGSNNWYYRPEIGVGYSIFHLSGGYNVFFKSEGSEDLATLQANFRIKHTF